MPRYVPLQSTATSSHWREASYYVSVLKAFLPPLRWLPTYSLGAFMRDVVAGLTVALTLVPQALAYATLAELPMVYGLYSSYIGGFVFCVLGSVKDVQVGPASILCLMVGQVVLSTPVEEVPAMLCTLTLLVGILQLALLICRLSFVLDFISHPVLVGFTNASAMTVAFKQVNVILGISIAPSPTFLTNAINLFPHLLEANGWSLLIGMISLAIILLAKRIHPLIPRSALVTAVATFLTWGFRLDELLGLGIVGQLPSTYPQPQLPDFSMAPSLVTPVIMIALVGLIEHTAVAKGFARLSQGSASMNSELLSLGVTNSLSALFSAFPVTGSFSRSTLSYEAGARSQLCLAVTALVSLVAMLFLTNLFTYIPNTTLGAVLLATTFTLIDFREMFAMLYIGLTDFGAMALTFLGVLLLGADMGIVIGVAFSLLVSFHRIARPYITVQEQDSADLTQSFDDDDSPPQGPSGAPGALRSSVRDFLIVQMNESLWFPNAQYFTDYVLLLFSDAYTHCSTEGLPLPRGVIVDFSGVHMLDESGLLGLVDVHMFLTEYHSSLIVCGAYGYTLSFLRNAARLLPAFNGTSPIHVIDKLSDINSIEFATNEDDGEPTDEERVDGTVIEMRSTSSVRQTPASLRASRVSITSPRHAVDSHPATLDTFALPPPTMTDATGRIPTAPWRPPRPSEIDRTISTGHAYPNVMFGALSDEAPAGASRGGPVPTQRKLYPLTSPFLLPNAMPLFVDSPWLRPSTTPPFTPRMITSTPPSPALRHRLTTTPSTLTVVSSHDVTSSRTSLLGSDNP